MIGMVINFNKLSGVLYFSMINTNAHQCCLLTDTTSAFENRKKHFLFVVPNLEYSFAEIILMLSCVLLQIVLFNLLHIMSFNHCLLLCCIFIYASIHITDSLLVCLPVLLL